ncbi:E3 ubiquitin-protein ligase E3D, partial [Tieghemiomyces parasiticus]
MTASPVPNFYAEALPQLRKVALYVTYVAGTEPKPRSTTAGTTDVPQPTLLFGPDRVEWAPAPTDSATAPITLRLPLPVDPTPIRAERLAPATDGPSDRSSLVFHLRATGVGLTQTTPHRRTFLAEREPPLAAGRLVNAKAIRCRQCHTFVARTQPAVPDSANNTEPFRPLDLPSEHWSELLDCWMCHPDEETKYIMKLPSAAAPERPAAGDSENDTHLFFKYAIEFTNDPVSEPTILRAPSTAFAVADLVESGKAHANYRFCLYRDRQHKEPVALLWLLHWNVIVSTNALAIGRKINGTGALRLPDDIRSDLAKLAHTPSEALKVGYLDSTIDAVAFQKHANQWRARGDVESLYYPAHLCTEIMGALRASSYALPPNLCQFNGFQVGLLL